MIDCNKNKITIFGGNNKKEVEKKSIKKQEKELNVMSSANGSSSNGRISFRLFGIFG